MVLDSETAYNLLAWRSSIHLTSHVVTSYFLTKSYWTLTGVWSFGCWDPKI